MCFGFFWLKMNEWMNENMSTWTYSFGFFSFKYFNKIHCFLLLTPVSYAFFVIDNDDIPDSCLGYMASWLHKMSETFPYRPVLLKKGFVYWSRELNMNIDTVAITFTTKYNYFCMCNGYDCNYNGIELIESVYQLFCCVIHVYAL